MHLLGKSKSKKTPMKRGRMSAAGEARIVTAQKQRWAKVRAAKKKLRNLYRNNSAPILARAEHQFVNESRNDPIAGNTVP